MTKIKTQNFFEVTTTETIPSSWDFDVSLTSAPTYTKWYIVFDFSNPSLREVVYFHNRSWSRIYVKWENRTSPTAHAIWATAKINNVAEFSNYLSEISSSFGFVEKLGWLNVMVWGGNIRNNETAVTIADTSLTLPANQTNYIYLDILDNTIKQTLTQSVSTTNAVQLATVVTSASGVSWVTVTRSDSIFFRGADWSTIGYDENGKLKVLPWAYWTVTSVTSANSDASVTNPTTNVVITINTGTTANKILKLDGSGKIPSVDGSQLTWITKTQVWLSNVDNTSDSSKPISTATQTALNAKVSSIQAGSGITVNNTDPQNPIISAIWGAWSGNVTQTSNSWSSGRIKVSAGADKSIQDYATAGLVKSDSNGVASAAVDGTDYLSPSTVQTEVNKNTYLKRMMSTALLGNAVMTINANPAKFDIPSFSAQFVDNYTNPSSPTVTPYTYPGSTANTVTNLATWDTTYISIDKNWVIYQSQTNDYGSNSRDRVTIGSLVHSSRTQIDYVNVFVNTVQADLANAIGDISEKLGIINKGNRISANGANLKINKSSGESTQIGLNWKNSKKNPNITTDNPLTAPSFLLTWRNGTGWWTTVSTSDIVPWRYDDGTGGATQPNGTVATNKWKLDKVYFAPDLWILAIEYGQAVYNTEAEAEAARSTDTVQNPATVGLVFRWWIIVRGWATTLNTSSNAVFVDAGKFGSTTGWTWSGSSTSTFQQVYENSTQPQVVTNSTQWAVQYKRGSASDTDKVYEVLNGAGTSTFSVNGNGDVNSSWTTYLWNSWVANGKLQFKNSTNSFTQTFTGSNPWASIEYILPTTVPTAGQVLSSTAPSAGVATLSWATASGGVSFWNNVPWSPTRTGNTTFTVTDTSNANKYDLLLSRWTQIRWTESSISKRGFVISATYATNTVTVTIVGDTMASIDASSLAYFVNKGQIVTFQYPWTEAVWTDITARFFADKAYRVYWARAILASAGTTWTLTVDINKNGTTMFTTKPTVASGSTVGSDFTADNWTSLSNSDYVSIDIDTVHTTAGSGLTVQLYIWATYDTNLT